MLKFNVCRNIDEKIDQWISLGINVILIGEKGIGKSHIVLDAFKRNNIKYAYFSGATLDPWIHLLGIPKAKEKDGKEYMDFILPSNLDEDVEAIFIDEYNRCGKVVKNALLELVQFKTINGRKFPNLRMIWGAINPPPSEDSEDVYEVEELDPAQLDRFPIIVELPNEPNKTYFNKKYGEAVGNILINWWNEQPHEAKRILSPRRLDYVAEYFFRGCDIYDMLPVSANSSELIRLLSIDTENEYVLKILNNPTKENMKYIFEDNNRYLKYKKYLDDIVYFDFFHLAKDKEIIAEKIKLNNEFCNFAIYRSSIAGDVLYKDLIADISKSNPQEWGWLKYVSDSIVSLDIQNEKIVRDKIFKKKHKTIAHSTNNTFAKITKTLNLDNVAKVRVSKIEGHEYIMLFNSMLESYHLNNFDIFLALCITSKAINSLTTNTLNQITELETMIEVLTEYVVQFGDKALKTDWTNRLISNSRKFDPEFISYIKSIINDAEHNTFSENSYVSNKFIKIIEELKKKFNEHGL